jgi:hypothetical protein
MVRCPMNDARKRRKERVKNHCADTVTVASTFGHKRPVVQGLPKKLTDNKYIVSSTVDDIGLHFEIVIKRILSSQLSFNPKIA